MSCCMILKLQLRYQASRKILSSELHQLHEFNAGQEELKHLKCLCVALSLCVALCPIRLTTT
jgi:hypothetical protein